ncbi:Zn-dependent oligopeptidase [Nocardioides sp. TRM66260-LWL]|uniref:M3 family metallopeptidase n=1 Tax=Nocardioides sp. TRM66260-LWL TaxID=2874478 RepID=UPI001CC6B6D6|nr:M3 family metallopeptidase [Nocardioides sp. TRM66260-LWL]MBZ5733650.1 Zn-dependent oligopeptidase [Nocardioides sp. TRM66260-LWL]
MAPATPTPLALPTDADPQVWRTFLDERAGGHLDEARRLADDLRALEPGDDAALSVWNDLGVALGNASAVCSLLSSVHPDVDLRARAEDLVADLSRFQTDLMLDGAVFARLDAVRAEGLDERLGDGATRVLDDALRGFRRSGVDRDDATRERLRALAERSTELEQTFARTIREGRRTTRVPAAALDGLPDDYREAHPADADGTVEIGTDYPDTNPFLAFSTDREARHAVHATFLDLGWPANDAVLGELLDLRDERARLLGYDGWADFDAEVKMIGSGAAIPEFVDRIAADATPAAERDRDILLARAREDHPGLTALDVSDARYYGEVVRRERFDVDAQQVRAYFDFQRVRQGLLDVTGRLFGLVYTDVDAASWHDDVSVHDVHLDGVHLGRIHLDLHPREGKYNHAAQFDLVPGVAGRQLPEGVLVCNFGRGRMEHSEVVTLFHEFGHLLHHVLAGRHPWARFSGVATEWDFVEAPSQMLEEWAWDAAVLQTFATDDAGTPIPAALVARMREAEEFGQGCYARTQMFYAAVSYRFHADRPADRTAALRELSERYAIFEALPSSHFHCGFGHLAGYTSAYYTYMWSLVIAKDLFSAFDADDLFAPDVARRYRDTVLAAGGSRDAADLVEAFLGRPYDSAAFRAWLGR